MSRITKQELVRWSGLPEQQAGAAFDRLDTDKSGTLDGRDVKGYDAAAFEATAVLLGSAKRARLAGDVQYAHSAWALGIQLDDAKPSPKVADLKEAAIYNLANVKLEAGAFAEAAGLLHRLRFDTVGQVKNDIDVHVLYARARWGQYERMLETKQPGVIDVSITDDGLAVKATCLTVLAEATTSYRIAAKLGSGDHAREIAIGMERGAFEFRRYAIDLNLAAVAPFMPGKPEQPPWGAEARAAIGVDAAADLAKVKLTPDDWVGLWGLWAAKIAGAP